MTSKFLHNLSIIIWVIFFIVLGMTYYVNHYMPHGPSFPTGDIVCQNDGRGPCGEEYKEEMSGLAIPEWAKFLREYFILVLLALGILGGYLNEKAKIKGDGTEINQM